jgi:TRAP-type C4-dicarboxylate transport system substrate-binding protein
MHRLLIVLAAAAVLAGCGGQSYDKAGGHGGHVRVLRLANANQERGELDAYAREVERVSGGRLRIQFVNDYGNGAQNAEPGIIADVRAGKIDLGWVGARAFSAEGLKAFDPLIAPFEVTTYDTEQQVLADPVARKMLDAVNGTRVQGVALLPGPLRRLAMRRPWQGPDDLRGKRIGAPAGIGSKAIAALGATPVVGGAQSKLAGLDGAEEHLPSFVGNFYMHEVPHVASEPLWPRPLVVIASPQAWRKLDERERGYLLDAGTSAALPMLKEMRETDAAAVPKLCRQGARFFEADADAMRSAVAPVIEGLRNDPDTAPVLATIDHLRAGAPAPLSCDGVAPARESGIPPGEYTFTLTEADRRSRPAGKKFGDPYLPEVFRVEVTPGHMVMRITPKGHPEEIGFEEDFSTFKDRFQAADLTGRFQIDEDGNLHFSDIEPSGGGDDFVFATKTWRRTK